MSKGSAISETTKSTDAVTVLSCYAAGLQALEQGDLTGAKAWAARCSAFADASGEARSAALNGRIAAEEGNFQEAVNLLRSALGNEPHDPGLARQLVEVLQINKQLDEAVKVLENLTQRDSNQPDLFIDLGYARLANGDRAGARQALERAASLRPQDNTVLFSLAQMYQAIDEPALAAEVLSEKLSGDVSPRILNDLARLFLHLQRYAEAEAEFRTLGERDPASALMALHGGIWCRMKCADWRGALELTLDATRLDRCDATTTFLSYAKDRVFGNPLDSSQREAELQKLLHLEISEYAELHSADAISWPDSGGN